MRRLIENLDDEEGIVAQLKNQSFERQNWI